VPTHKDLDERAQRTDAAAAALIQAERVARLEKTHRLRAMWLARAGGPPSRPNTRTIAQPPNDGR
jgi:hypothetical protein